MSWMEVEENDEEYHKGLKKEKEEYHEGLKKEIRNVNGRHLKP